MANDRKCSQFENSGSGTVGGVNQQSDHNDGKGFKIRHVQAAVLAAAAFVAYSVRISLSVGIVAMVHNNETAPEDELAETYDWNGKEQGYVLSSFFFGYMFLQIPAGIITEKYGGHRFLCFAVIGSSLLTVLVPQSAYLGGWQLLCANRIFQGVCQGFLFPSVYTLLGLWCPTPETTRMTSITLGATFLGMAGTTPVAGYLVKLYGWPTVFYVCGGLGVVLGIMMFILGADSPAKHRWISAAERRYIESTLGGGKVQRSVPWKAVLTSPPYLVALLGMSCYTLGYFILLTKIPTYLSTVLKFNIQDSGVLTALPYLVALVASFVFSTACECIVDREIVNLTTARKCFNTIAHFGSAACIVLVGHVENRILSVALMCGLMGCQAASIIGVQSNFVDLAPNFSGPIYSVANFMSAFLGLVGPVLVGFIVTEEGSAEQWRIVFYLCASVLVVSNVVYVFIGSSETQWWNWPDKYKGNSEMQESDIRSAYIRKRSMPRMSIA